MLKFDDFIPDYHFEMRRNALWKNKNDFSIRNEVDMYIVKNKIPVENVFYSLADNEYRIALKPNTKWTPLWISNYSASPKNSAKFIAEEFLTRL